MDDGHDDPGIWSNAAPTERRPTRPPKDPLLSVTKLTVHSLEEFESALRDYLDNTPGEAEHAQCELEVWGGAQVLVQETRHGHLAVNDRNTMTIAEALLPREDTKDVMKRQRAIAKVFIDSIQRTDGFRYAFHNNWKSGEDYRFSYYCNDSLLNKDRVANGKTGSHGKRAYKPVYDCKGVMAVKFSTSRQCVDIVYKHVPIHDTYEARAPPPRKDAKRRRDWEITHPNRVRAPQYIDQAITNANRALDGQQPKPKADKPPKKKRPKKSSTTAEADLREESMRSLLELIRGDETPAEPNAAQQDQAPAVQPAIERPPSGTQRQQSAQNGLGAGRPRTGCALCRAKRIKCDGAKPTCQPCRSRVWPCFYIEPGSTDDQNLPPSLGDLSPLTSNAGNNRHIAVDLSGDSSSGPNAQLANESLSTELFDTKTELALLKEKLREAEEKVKVLEAGKARPTTTPAQRRTPQVSGVRGQHQQPNSADEQRNSTQSNGYNSMAYQIAQSTNQNYGSQPGPAQQAPNFAAQQPSHRQQRQQQQHQKQTYPQPQPQQTYAQPQQQSGTTAQQTSYVQPQQTATANTQQPYVQPQQTSSSRQSSFARPQSTSAPQQPQSNVNGLYGQSAQPQQTSSGPQQQPSGVSNLYGQSAGWPGYGYNMPQQNPYQSMGSRMR